MGRSVFAKWTCVIKCLGGNGRPAEIRYKPAVNFGEKRTHTCVPGISEFFIGPQEGNRQPLAVGRKGP